MCENKNKSEWGKKKLLKGCASNSQWRDDIDLWSCGDRGARTRKETSSMNTFTQKEFRK